MIAIREIRTHLGVSQTALAEACAARDRRGAAYWRIAITRDESGARPLTPDQRTAVLRALGVGDRAHAVLRREIGAIMCEGRDAAVAALRDMANEIERGEHS